MQEVRIGKQPRVLSGELVVALMGYLQKRPYEEVYMLISGIASSPVQEKEETDGDA